MDNIIFRVIVKEDLDEIFLLLQQLTEIDYSDRDKEKCWELFKTSSSHSIVGVLKNKIIAYGSLVLEYKIRGEAAGHIEDIVVDKNIRGKNVGVNLINKLIDLARCLECYRVTLLCDESLINFYSKNNLKVSGVAMKKFINK
jgi:GNAT superfamily N-acetyltransferase|tara:strand:- start:2772 stop:3197 length:426 start_codon:yes stop_codon:yes gene_type:complete